MSEVAEYKIVDKPRKDKKNLEGIETRKHGRRPNSFIQLEEWNDWDSSFWVRIERHGEHVIVDSGVIEELAEEIKRLKSPLNKLLVDD